MRYIIEVWDKGKLISHEEKNDGLPDIQDLEKRLKIVEEKLETVAIPAKE